MSCLILVAGSLTPADASAEGSQLYRKGLRQYQAGRITLFAGAGIGSAYAAMSSHWQYGYNHFTYLPAFNYPMVLGVGLLAGGVRNMARGAPGYVTPSVFRSGVGAYCTSIALFVIGTSMLVIQNPEHAGALYRSADVTKGGGVGVVLCLTSTIMNLIAWRQLYKQKRAIGEIHSEYY
jgi:hypothetical protein